MPFLLLKNLSRVSYKGKGHGKLPKLPTAVSGLGRRCHARVRAAVVGAGEAETGSSLGSAASAEGGNQRPCLKQQAEMHPIKTHYQLLAARSYTHTCTCICMYMNIYTLRRLKINKKSSELLLIQSVMITGKPRSRPLRP